MSKPGLLTEDDLMEWTGVRQRTALERLLRKLGIAYGYGAGNRIVTTQAAVDAALVGRIPPADDIEF